LQFGGRIIVLLIAPEGIEISLNLQFGGRIIVLLIAPEGIEIDSFLKGSCGNYSFNRTRRN